MHLAWIWTLCLPKIRRRGLEIFMRDPTERRTNFDIDLLPRWVALISIMPTFPPSNFKTLLTICCHFVADLVYRKMHELFRITKWNYNPSLTPEPAIVLALPSPWTTWMMYPKHLVEQVSKGNETPCSSRKCQSSRYVETSTQVSPLFL